MSPPSWPILPPEVIDLIIDDLHDHSPTLRTCSLVSRNWLGGSRHHLFNRMYLTGRNLRLFRDLLRSPNNTLSFHIRSLHAAGFRHNEFTELWQLLSAFPHLRSLEINLDTKFEVSNIQVFPSVHSLSLSHAIFQDHRRLTALIGQFPSLKTLTLHRLYFARGETPISTSLIPQLNALYITLTPGVWGWLRSTGFSLLAQSVDMDIETIETGLSEYFDALGTQLRRLRLKFHDPAHLAIFSEQSRLAHNTALRSLRISHAFWILGESDVGISPSLPRFLQQLGSSGLQELEFDATLAYNVAPGWVPSSPHEVATMLDGADFAGLQSINFYGPWDHCDDILSKQFRSIISDLLPVQVARGAVHVLAHTFG
ncbi:hypothetical protein DFH06DRAFT_1247660 [Mycena polygramma]|nr:hypothetical protein DFH06DRAFT_1247660 [Mycena polygramma]